MVLRGFFDELFEPVLLSERPFPAFAEGERGVLRRACSSGEDGSGVAGYEAAESVRGELQGGDAAGAVRGGI